MRAARIHPQPELLTDAGRAARFSRSLRRHTVFEKHWRDVVSRRTLDEFWQALQLAGGSAGAPPVQSAGKLAMAHVSRGALLLVGVLARDVPALLAVELLHRVGDLLERYLVELTEHALRANFVTVYQLLDEIIDNGAPLHTEPNVLQQLVMQVAHTPRWDPIPAPSGASLGAPPPHHLSASPRAFAAR